MGIVFITFLWLPTWTLAINLSRQGLKDIPENVKANETTLEIEYNEIRHIRQGAFSGFKFLQYLGLSHNKISTIAPGAFHGLPALETLSLYKNQIRSIPDFSHLLSLIDLSIGKNPIPVLNPKQFGNLAKLTTFSSQGCEFRGKLFLPKLKSLQAVSLQMNQFTELAENLFDGFQHLKYVDLTYNKLSSLPQLGDGMKNITRLFLKRNRFYHFPNFSNYENLQFLDISHNYITIIPNDFLPTTIALLVLRENPIECLAENYWCTPHSRLNTLLLTCSDGKVWRKPHTDVLCQGNSPDSKVHGANMGPTWGRQDPGGPHVGPRIFVIWETTSNTDMKRDILGLFS